MLKVYSVAGLIFLSSIAQAQVFEMVDKKINKDFYYSYIFAPTSSVATEWAASWSADKKLVIYTIDKSRLKVMATYDLKPDFYNIESGVYLLQLKDLDRPLFVFVLNHGAPVSTLYLIDPKDTVKPKFVLKINSDEFELSVQGNAITVIHPDTIKKARQKVTIDTEKLGIL